MVKWLRESPGPALQSHRSTGHTVSVEQKLLCVMQFYAADGNQGRIARPLSSSRLAYNEWSHRGTGTILERFIPWIRFSHRYDKAFMKRYVFLFGGMDWIIGVCNLYIYRIEIGVVLLML